MHADSVAVLDIGATANLICFRWLERHNRLQAKRGYPKVSTYSSTARPRFGDGRLGEVRHAADTTVGIAGHKDKFAACALDTGTPALLREGAM